MTMRLGGAIRLPVWLRVVILLVLLALLTMIAAACSVQREEPPALEPGMEVPGFELDSFAGERVVLSDYAGQTVLLAFLQADGEPGTAAYEQSRAQVNVLKSMQVQFGTSGLQTLVALSSAGGASDRAEDAGLNFVYDWRLEDFPVFLPSAARLLVERYAVGEVPALFLISSEGKLLRAWSQAQSASTLALALEELLGPPAFRL